MKAFFYVHYTCVRGHKVKFTNEQTGTHSLPILSHKVVLGFWAFRARQGWLEWRSRGVLEPGRGQDLVEIEAF